MNKIKYLFAVLLLAPTLALAAGAEVKLDRAPVNEEDHASLQRGARHFANYCLNCHSASYMRFNRLQDIGLSEAQIRDNLVFTGVKVGELMRVAMDPKDAKNWFGATPPDLSVVARSRASADGSGADWLYTYLRGFYRDAERPTGWNNTVFPSVGMPHALWELQGEQVLAERKVRGDGYMKTEMVLKLDKPGQLTPVQYDEMVADLVNYMVFMAEPVRSNRKTMGLFVLMGLGLLFIFAYALKKEYWKDVH